MSPALRRVMRNQGIVTAESIGRPAQPRVQDHAVQILLDAPGAYWRMDDLTDSAVHGNTLTQNGTVPTTTGLVPGEQSLARSWDGTSTNYLSAADSNSLDVADTFSLEAWIKITADPAVGVYRCIMSKGANAFWFGIHRLGTGIEIVGFKLGVASFVTSSNLFTVGVTYHVVLTKSGDSTRLYVNGVDRTGTTTTGLVLANTTSVLQIGRADPTEIFTGTIDDVAVFPTVLSAARVLAHYTGNANAQVEAYPDSVVADAPQAFWTWS